MIAFFVQHRWEARALATAWSSVTEEVDGPFRLVKGRWRGMEARAFVVRLANGDAAYAAARLAARRGARVLFPVSECWRVMRQSEREEAPEALLLPIAEVWDLAGAEGLLRVLPDSARELPLKLDDFLPAEALWQGDGAEDAGRLSCATLPWFCGNPRLSLELRQRLGVNLLDWRLSGYAAAALEEEVMLVPFALLARWGRPDGWQFAPPQLLEEELRCLVEQAEIGS